MAIQGAAWAYSSRSGHSRRSPSSWTASGSVTPQVQTFRGQPTVGLLSVLLHGETPVAPRFTRIASLEALCCWMGTHQLDPRTSPRVSVCTAAPKRPNASKR